MKKMLITTAAFALVAMSVSAADVYSSNVVGYTKLTVNAGTYTMLGVQFQAIGGGSMAINDLFAEPSDNAFVGGPGLADADNLQIWGPATSGYTQYYFGDWSGAYGTEYDNLWYKDGDDEFPTTDTLPPGAAVWFVSKGATSATVSPAGEVVATSVAVTLYGETYTMVSNPFPAPMSLADVTNGGTVNWINAGLTGGPGLADADNVQIWDAGTSSYTQYYYGDWNGAYGTEFDNQWYKDGDDEFPTTDSIPVGGSAWFILKGVGNVSVTFPSPL